MTPSQFMQSYRTMIVPLDNNQQTNVDVHQYLINVASSAHNAIAAKAMWDKISGKLSEQARKETKAAADAVRAAHPPLHAAAHGHPHTAGHGRPQGANTATAFPRAPAMPGVPTIVGAAPLAVGPPKTVTRADLIRAIDPTVTDSLLAAVPLGKGTPNAIKAYLRLAVRYKLATQTGLQKFCDDRNVGLDCSGFVSNFLVALGQMNATAIVNTGADSFDKADHRRATLESVRALDIVVWDDGNHVAIVDDTPVAVIVADPPKRHPHGHAAAPAPPTTHTEYTCTVVESNGHRGLASETYTLKSVDKHKLFTVAREDLSEWKVHLVNRNLTA